MVTPHAGGDVVTSVFVQAEPQPPPAARHVLRPFTARVPVEIAGCGYAGRAGAKDPAGGAPAAGAGWVPVEPVGSAVCFVVRCPGGGGALLGVTECACAA
eukprot:scaffold22937_cov60-Phaeocystis_antarctica.AAC.2